MKDSLKIKYNALTIDALKFKTMFAVACEKKGHKVATNTGCNSCQSYLRMKDSKDVSLIN